MSCGLGVAGVDDDDLHAGLPLKIEVAVGCGQVGGTGVEAPQDDALGTAQVGLEGSPAGHCGLHHEGGNPAEQGVMAHVGGAEEVHEAAACPVVGTQGTSDGSHGLCAALCLDGVDLVGNLGESLVPRDALPLVLALLARALERVVDASRGIVESHCLVATCAQTTGVGRVGIALGVQQLAILNVGENAAVVVAEVATGFPDLDTLHLKDFEFPVCHLLLLFLLLSQHLANTGQADAHLQVSRAPSKPSLFPNRNRAQRYRCHDSPTYNGPNPYLPQQKTSRQEHADGSMVYLF